jgi:hypothetical protein
MGETAHGRHRASPSLLYSADALQAMQAEPPRAGWTVPARQVEHADPPAEAEYLPGRQAWQALPPLADWKLPAPHRGQMAAPDMLARVPALQESQPVVPGEDAYRPGAHGLQARAVMAPDLAENVPFRQGAHSSPRRYQPSRQFLGASQNRIPPGRA